MFQLQLRLFLRVQAPAEQEELLPGNQQICQILHSVVLLERHEKSFPVNTVQSIQLASHHAVTALPSVGVALLTDKDNKSVILIHRTACTV